VRTLLRRGHVGETLERLLIQGAIEYADENSNVIAIDQL
jgi:hypothetical protein